MVYDWSPHKDVLYDLYIQQRKPLEEIIQHMRDTFHFAPSKRAYQTQFRRWQFPSKQNPAHRNLDLVARVQQLWEQNFSQRDMLTALNEEEYNIKERELMRLRAKHRWLLRVPNGTKNLEQQVVEAAAEPDHKRKELHDQRQAESDERWAAKKRRRRTRDYAGLAADPPGPPRFPSETTLEESKQFLVLDNEGYRQVREQFQAICEDQCVIKKTLAGNDKWQAVKDRLVHENAQLQTAFWSNTVNQEAKALALDVICTDVTKRMRTMSRRMTIAEAKNVLGMNPEQSRQIRNSLYTVLKADGFTSKLEAGDEHWQELKQGWIDNTPYLQQLLNPSFPDHTLRAKALDFICRDVVKRVREDIKRLNPLVAQSDFSEPGNDLPELGSTAPAESFPPSAIDDVQIDPSLLQAAVNFTNPLPVPVYIKSHAQSEIHHATKMWLGTLTTRTVAELSTLLRSKWSDAAIARVDGIKKLGNRQEVSYLIEEDEELEAYLEDVQGGKAVFVALLGRK